MRRGSHLNEAGAVFWAAACTALAMLPFLFALNYPQSLHFISAWILLSAGIVAIPFASFALLAGLQITPMIRKGLVPVMGFAAMAAMIGLMLNGRPLDIYVRLDSGPPPTSAIAYPGEPRDLPTKNDHAPSRSTDSSWDPSVKIRRYDPLRDNLACHEKLSAIAAECLHRIPEHSRFEAEITLTVEEGRVISGEGNNMRFRDCVLRAMAGDVSELMSVCSEDFEARIQGSHVEALHKKDWILPPPPPREGRPTARPFSPGR